MSVSLEDLEKQARELTSEDRAKLAEALLESLHVPPLADVEAAWAQEIEDRVAAFERGEAQTYDAGDVFAEARRLLR